MLENAHTIFLVGIKGVAMSNLAVILKQMGKTVRGTDIDDVFITDQTLTAHNIISEVGFNPDLLTSDIDLVIYSAAHQGKKNPITQKALALKIPLLHEAQIRGALIHAFPLSIAVSGSHGKTTTSGLLAYALTHLQVNPSYLVGTSSFGELHGGNYGTGEYFVVEADEYGIDPPSDKTSKLTFFYPKYILTTNIDFDHPDMYANMKEVQQTFSDWYRQTFEHDPKSELVVCFDNEALMEVVTQFPKERYMTYGLGKNADYQAHNIQYANDHTEFDLTDSHNNQLGHFQTALFGEKNVSNVVGAIALLLHLGFTSDAISQSIKSFSGAKRRFEEVYKQGSISLFDDYAHHPEEIKAMITATRQRFPGSNIVIIFQPHTYSRTQQFKDQFINAFSLADHVILSPIYASAREDSSQFTITSDALVKEAQEKGLNNISTYKTIEELKAQLAGILEENLVIFTMGAGNIYKIKNDIIDVIKSRV